MADIIVTSGQVRSNATVGSGVRMYVSSGGTATATTVNPYGSMFVSRGGTATSTTVNDGYLRVSSGGTAITNTVNRGGIMTISSGGLASNTTVSSGGSMFVFSGGIATETTVNSGRLSVSSGGTATATTINSGGWLSVSSGGTATRTIVNSYGDLWVSSGGTATSTTVNGGDLYVPSGGTALEIVENGGYVQVADGANVTFVANTFSGLVLADGRSATVHSGTTATETTVYSDGDMVVLSGGTATETTVNSYGDLYVSSGGTATATTVNPYGNMVVLSGGTATETTVNSYGDLYVTSGGTATSTTVNSDGRLYVSSGGTATSTTVNPAGSVYVSSGGTATDIVASQGAILRLTVAPDTYIQGTSDGSAFEMKDAFIANYTVNSGGCLDVASGGIATETTVNSGCSMRVSSGGTATSTTVSSGGLLLVSSGGTATGTTIDSGGLYIFSGGTAIQTTVNSWGGLTVGGTATETTVNYYGSMFVSRGGTATRTTVNGGYMEVYSGTATSTTVNGGALLVCSGGTATSTTVNSGGSMLVYESGTHRGTLQIASGAVVSAYAGAVIDYTLSGRTASDGYLINDLRRISGAPTYTITVDADQAYGTYKLAQGASSFSGSITVGNGSVNYGSVTVNGSGLDREGKRYLLVRDGGNLTLSITDILPPDAPTASADITSATNQDVTVSATFSNDTAVKQYSLDNSTWQTYTGGVVMSANGTVSFRGYDAAGNVSDITSYTVSTIDKAAPDVPTGFNETVTINSVKIEWAEAADNGGAGLSGYMFRYGSSSELSGDGEFLAVDEKEITDLAIGSYFYQVRSVDNAGNLSDWSDVRSFLIVDYLPGNLQSSSDTVSWDDIPGASGCRVDFSQNVFSEVITIETASSQVDMFGLPAGIYQWRVGVSGRELFSVGADIVSSRDEAPQRLVSHGDGNADLFFTQSSETWGSFFSAQHTGTLDGWQGTGELVYLKGKNRIADVFAGSADANILVLTDDAKGDALFVDDIYTALPDGLSDQARISQIKEIRAGAGDDIVDLTSQQFAYTNGLTVYGGLGDDTIWANTGNNRLFGDAGNDRIIGAAGDDLIVGGIGNDTMHGGGGNDVFTFCSDWGTDTVEQLAGGTVTLWFAFGSMDNWDASTLTYTDGANSVTVSGITAENITLKFGDASPDYAALSAAGAFTSAASEKIFEDPTRGMIA